jgi:hypothetical protein
MLMLLAEGCDERRTTAIDPGRAAEPRGLRTRESQQVESRIRVWRSPDIERQSADWLARQTELGNTFWKLRMKGRS